MISYHPLFVCWTSLTSATNPLLIKWLSTISLINHLSYPQILFQSPTSVIPMIIIQTDTDPSYDPIINHHQWQHLLHRLQLTFILSYPPLINHLSNNAVIIKTSLINHLQLSHLSIIGPIIFLYICCICVLCIVYYVHLSYPLLITSVIHY